MVIQLRVVVHNQKEPTLNAYNSATIEASCCEVYLIIEIEFDLPVNGKFN